MKFLFVFLMILALFQIQPVAATKHDRACAAKHDKDTLYRPDFAGGSLCNARWFPSTQEWLSTATNTINGARGKDRDYSGYSFEFDVDQVGLINHIKTMAPRNADRRSPEGFLEAIILPDQVPMKTTTSYKRHLQLVLSKFPNATLQFAD